MSDSESLDYLQPGFEAKSLTIPRLRSILVAHNVPYSSSAKKAQLVELFNEEVIPQSKKILAARARAKRSSKGIFDADEQSTSSSNPFNEDLPPPPSAYNTRRSRSPRKASTRIKPEEVEHQPMPPPVPIPSKRKSRASSRQLQASDTETGSEMDGRGTTRRTRKTEGTPQLKMEESDGLFRRTSDVFTRDNPFQSASSSPPAEKPSTRKSTAGTEQPRRSTGSSRRRTQQHVAQHDYEEDSPSNYSTFAAPAKQVSRQKTPEKLPEASLLEPGEEFTPEEQLELVVEQAANPETAIVSRQLKQPSQSGWGTPLSVIFVTLLGAYAGWYRQEKIAVGYCGVGQFGNSIPSEIDVPEWAQAVLPPQISVPSSIIDTLEPECVPCPSHAYCYADFSVRCEQDYLLKPHPFSLGGLVPLPPTCEPDGQKVRRVQAVADRAVEELRERTAKFECGELVDEQGVKADSPAIEEQELKEIINKKRSKKMNNQEFEDLWGAALGEIKERDEVEVEVKEATDSSSIPNTYLSSTSLARISITCAIRRSIRLGLARHRFQISLVIASIMTLFYARSRFIVRRAESAQVPALVDLVLSRLAQQKELGEEDIDDPWLFLPNLRDDVLRSIHSLKQRERIWHRVKAVVEQNSNVRTGQREGRSGEVGKAWEWIGASAGDSGRRRRSGRVSFGPDVKTEDSPNVEEKSYLHQKWEEGRPVY